MHSSSGSTDSRPSPISGNRGESLAQKNNILVVDDSPDICSVLSVFLETCTKDGTILTARDGKEAVEYLMTTKIDILLTDLNMPRMNGFELVAYAIQHNPGTRIIVMSGENHPALPFHDIPHIQKPFLLDDIARIVISAPVSE